MRNLITLTLMLILAMACCKQPILDKDTIIGNWEIIEIDSCLHPGRGDDPFIHKDPLPYSGTIEFFDDSTGIFHLLGGSILVGDDSSFIWTHDILNQMVEFSLESGTTTGVISTINSDYFEIYIRDYRFPPPPFFNIKPYYYLNLKRK